VIHLRRQQVIQHIHGGGEQNALVGLAGFPAEDLGQECFAHARITDEHDVGPLPQEGEIEQAQDAVLGLDAAFVMVEVKGVDGGLNLQASALEATLNRTMLARVQFHVGEPFQRGRDAEVSGCGFSDRRLQISSHRL